MSHFRSSCYPLEIPRTVPRAGRSGGREPSGVSHCWAQPIPGPSSAARFPVSTGGRAAQSPRMTRAKRLTGWQGWVVVLGALGSAVTLGCGSEAPLTLAGEDSTEPTAGSTEPSGAETRDDSSSVGQIATAPGIPAGSYPNAPYGTRQGATIENLQLYGWRNPVAAGFELEAAGAVRLGDFYNPDGARGEGVEYIMINAVAAWCGVCRTEYQDMRTKQTYSTLAPRGLEMVGVLFEDNNGDPSTFQDMINWAKAYSVGFPFVNDPGFETGVYFDKSATPMNMLIDARTMEIVLLMTGYNPVIYDQIDQLLTQRGR